VSTLNIGALAPAGSACADRWQVGDAGETRDPNALFEVRSERQPRLLPSPPEGEALGGKIRRQGETYA